MAVKNEILTSCCGKVCQSKEPVRNFVCSEPVG